jgi:nucleotide-binding universal stress UspA family protein
MFDKILLPIDGSDASDRAAHIAADLASRCGAEIIVLHVCEREYVYGVDISPSSSRTPTSSSSVTYDV